MLVLVIHVERKTQTYHHKWSTAAVDVNRLFWLPHYLNRQLHVQA